MILSIIIKPGLIRQRLIPGLYCNSIVHVIFLPLDVSIPPSTGLNQKVNFKRNGVNLQEKIDKVYKGPFFQFVQLSNPAIAKIAVKAKWSPGCPAVCIK